MGIYQSSSSESTPRRTHHTGLISLAGLWLGLNAIVNLVYGFGSIGSPHIAHDHEMLGILHSSGWISILLGVVQLLVGAEAIIDEGFAEGQAGSGSACPPSGSWLPRPRRVCSCSAGGNRVTRGPAGNGASPGRWRPERAKTRSPQCCWRSPSLHGKHAPGCPRRPPSNPVPEAGHGRA